MAHIHTFWRDGEIDCVCEDNVSALKQHADFIERNIRYTYNQFHANTIDDAWTALGDFIQLRNERRGLSQPRIVSRKIVQ